jgi:NADP-dependent 3-hydroxy acid dehydrogenase YdfG
MIDINVKAYCMFLKPSSHKYERKSGHIINSVPLLQKKFIQTEMYIVLQNMRLTLNQGMRMDLNPFGIRGAIHPGMVQTEFSEVRFKGDRAGIPRVHTPTRSC